MLEKFHDVKISSSEKNHTCLATEEYGKAEMKIKV